MLFIQNRKVSFKYLFDWLISLLFSPLVAVHLLLLIGRPHSPSVLLDRYLCSSATSYRSCKNRSGGHPHYSCPLLNAETTSFVCHTRWCASVSFVCQFRYGILRCIMTTPWIWEGYSYWLPWTSCCKCLWLCLFSQCYRHRSQSWRLSPWDSESLFWFEKTSLAACRYWFSHERIELYFIQA